MFLDNEGMGALISFNGALIPKEMAKVGVLNHGLHYSSSVFEGLRSYRGRIFKLREHTDRLLRSGEDMGWDYTRMLAFSFNDIRLDREELVDAIMQATLAVVEQTPEDVAEANAKHGTNLVHKDLSESYIRPLAWLGSEVLGVTTLKSKIHIAIAAWSDWNHYITPQKRAEGSRLILGQKRRPSVETSFCTSKAAGMYEISTFCINYAKQNGYDDALMLDWEGKIAETTSSNLFFWRGDTLVTPTPRCFLNGITRQTVIQLAQEKLGLQVEERIIGVEELADFDGAFVTGTAVEVVPVKEINLGEDKIHNFAIPEKTRTIIDLYFEETGKEDPEYYAFLKKAAS